MTKILILGHGDFHAKPNKGPGEVLIPPNTSLQFYANAGQSLVLPTVYDAEDYQQVANSWSQLKPGETPYGAGPLAGKRATYNFRLQPDDSEEHRDGARILKVGSDVEVYFIDAARGETFLCTGSEETCPTPGLRVAEIRGQQLKAMGEDAVAMFKAWVEAGANPPIPVDIRGPENSEPLKPEEVLWSNKNLFYQYVASLEVPAARWDHKCDGLLCKYTGHDLHWVACTAFDTARVLDSKEFRRSVADMTVLDTSAASGPGADPTFFDPDFDQATLDDLFGKQNSHNMLEMGLRKPKDKKVAVVATPKIVLIGPDHNRGPADWVRSQNDKEDGMIQLSETFKRFVVTGIENASNQDQVYVAIRAADAANSHLKVEFRWGTNKRELSD